MHHMGLVITNEASRQACCVPDLMLPFLAAKAESSHLVKRLLKSQTVTWLE